MADEKHKHEWQPNGTMSQDAVSRSPCSTFDDVLYTETYSLALCKCGAERKRLQSVSNQRFRGGGNASHVVYMLRR